MKMCRWTGYILNTNLEPDLVLTFVCESTTFSCRGTCAIFGSPLLKCLTNFKYSPFKNYNRASNRMVYVFKRKHIISSNRFRDKENRWKFNEASLKLHSIPKLRSCFDIGKTSTQNHRCIYAGHTLPREKLFFFFFFHQYHF